MADLIGFTSIAFVSLLTILVALKNADISKILFTALILRILIMLIGYYIFPLPDSTGDAVGFEFNAWELAEFGLKNVFDNFRGPDSQFISWFIGILYSLIGRSQLFAQSVSLLFGIGCVFLGWKLANLIWNKQIAKKVAWTIALFPSLVLYSVLIMREVYIGFFLLLALTGVVYWVKKKELKYIFLALIGFVGATFFHGAMLAGAIVFLSAVGYSSIKIFFKSLVNKKINLKSIISLSLFLVLLTFYVTGKISVPYLGSINNTLDMSNLIRKANGATRGNTSYPEWTKFKSPIEIFYKAPIRGVFFLFSPLPWQIKELKHLIGFFDAMLYFYLSILILINRKRIWKDPSLRLIFFILIFYIIVFAVGVGNYGTAIRHRSKFTIFFILLAAPLINRIIFSRKLD